MLCHISCVPECLRGLPWDVWREEHCCLTHQGIPARNVPCSDIRTPEESWPTSLGCTATSRLGKGLLGTRRTSWWVRGPSSSLQQGIPLHIEMQCLFVSPGVWPGAFTMKKGHSTCGGADTSAQVSVLCFFCWRYELQDVNRFLCQATVRAEYLKPSSVLILFRNHVVKCSN